MSYIQDEYYILKQNLIMLKHNIRLNKIEYTIALLLFIFYYVFFSKVNRRFSKKRCTTSKQYTFQYNIYLITLSLQQIRHQE